MYEYFVEKFKEMCNVLRNYKTSSVKDNKQNNKNKPLQKKSDKQSL